MEMAIGHPFSVQITEAEREKGSWEAALQRAISEAEAEASEESYKALKDLLLPFLARPKALVKLLELAARWDPEGQAKIHALIRTWIQAAQGQGGQEKPPPPRPPVVSRTLADLYYRQGHREEAQRLYKTLLSRNPQDQVTLREYLERFPQGDQGPGQGQLLRSLQEMVHRIRTARMASRQAEVEEANPGG